MEKKLFFGASNPWLAPLAGFSDLPFRLLCRENGAAVACTEMVSAKGLVYGRRQKKGDPQGTEDLLTTSPEDNPLVVQLFGAEPEFVGEAVRILVDQGYSWFDLNMGCSVPKVTKTGAGSAMMRDIPNALKVAESMIQIAGVEKVGFKFRLGWDKNSSVYLYLAKALQNLGAGWVTLHPRFARQAFSGKADWEALRLLRQEATLPVIASGDLFTVYDGLNCIKETGVDTLLFARGAITNPAIFRLFIDKIRQSNNKVEGVPQEFLKKAEQEGTLTPVELFRLVKRHAELAKELTPGRPGKKGFPPGFLKMRTVVPRYVRHLPGSKALRYQLTQCTSWSELDKLIDSFFSSIIEEEK